MPLEKVDEAVAWAVAHNLVAADGLPAHGLTVTHEGIMLAEKTKTRSRRLADAALSLGWRPPVYVLLFIVAW